MTPPPLTIRLFGPLFVTVRGEPLPRVRTRSVEWLLALLVLRHGRAVDRAWLAGTLRPESDKSRALQNLRDDLMWLGKALGPEGARIQSPARDLLTLDLAGAEVDIVRFDSGIGADDESSLREAVAVYTGPLLEGCAEEWVLLERERRAEQCLTALESLAARAEARGEARAAIQYLRRAETIDPLRDSTQQGLMRLLAATGDAPAALLTYREYRARLHREMNAEPEEETARLFQEIRARAREAAAVRPPRPVSPSPRRPVTPSPGHPVTPSPRRPAPLPYPMTTLIGREEDVQTIADVLRRSRLVTLVGGGGVGKTRLAIQVAAVVADGLAAEAGEPRFPDGEGLSPSGRRGPDPGPGRAAFVELAPLADPALLPAFVAASLGMHQEAAPQPRMQALIGSLSSQPMLLVLDNCEHLIQAAAELAQTLLEACPALWILATSRQRLGLTGEIAWRVPSLPAPDPEQIPPDAPSAVEQVLQFPAAQLLVERAAMARPGFRVRDRDDALAVARICHRLDGIPLAIELAAARVPVLPVAQIAARLDDRFRLLTGGSRAALPRHQTLRALIDWSYDGLPEAEAALLRRLSVFAGGWTLEAAGAVIASDGAASGALDLLDSLEDRSLVLVEQAAQDLRYRMLETVREYAREKLRACGEEASARAAHAAYFLTLAETAEAAMTGLEQLLWLNVLEAEHANLRTALAWCLESPDDGAGEIGLRLACAIQSFWVIRYHVDEGRQYLGALLASPQAEGRTAARAAALRAAGALAALQSDYAAARARGEESLAICEELGDRLGIARALSLLTSVISDREQARQMATRSLALFREANDPFGVASVLTRLSEFASAEQDHDTARAFHHEALSIARSIGDQTLEAGCLSGLASIEYERRDYAAAREHFQGSLTLARELGMYNQTAVSLYFLGLLAFQESDYAAARSLWEECREIDRRNQTKGGSVLGALAELVALQGDTAAARARWEESLAEGRELGRPDLVARALRGLGGVARFEGDAAGALAWYSDSLEAAQAAASRPESKIADERHSAECAACLRGIAAILSRSGREEPATRLLGAAEALAEAVGAALPAAERTGYQDQTAALRGAMGEEAFAGAWAEGRAMSPEQAIQYALEEVHAA